MIKHTQTIRRLLPTNCLSVFDHFVGLALKGLRFNDKKQGVENELRISTKLTVTEQNFICLLSSPFCIILTKNTLY